jgi:hypothetical protein
MSNQRLLRIIVEETVRSPNRQADAKEVRRLYGDAFDFTLNELRALGYIARNSLDGHIALTPAGLAAARESLSSR